MRKIPYITTSHYLPNSVLNCLTGATFQINTLQNNFKHFTLITGTKMEYKKENTKRHKDKNKQI